MCIRASADGSAFAAWLQHGSPSGIRFLTIDGNQLTYRYEHTSASPLLPSFDGSELFTSLGVLKPAEIQIAPGGGLRAGVGMLMPTYNPAYYVGIDRGNDVPMRDLRHLTITIFSTADHQSLLTVSDIEDWVESERARVPDEELTPDKRLLVMPDQRVIITVPSTNDRLVLHHFNLLKRLDEAGIDYFFTESLPPHSITKGADLSYPITVRSRRGNVSFHLDSGPEGMKVSSTGIVTWHCPAQVTDETVSAIISIKDDSGQQIYQSLTLNIE
jgi:hypothetical protein